MPRKSVSPRFRFNCPPGLPAAGLQALIDSSQVREVRRRHPILLEGKRAENVYVVLSGIVKVTTMGTDPKRVLVGLIGPGEVFGLAALTSAPNHRYRCDAFNDCIIAEVGAGKFVEIGLGISIDRLRAFMAITMGRWWWGLPIWYLRTGQLSLEHRLIALLGELSRKFGVRDDRGTIINVRLTHADLAELLGCARTKLTGELKRLEASRMIERPAGRLIVADLLRTRLEDIAERRRRDIETTGLRDDRPACGAN